MLNGAIILSLSLILVVMAASQSAYSLATVPQFLEAIDMNGLMKRDVESKTLDIPFDISFYFVRHFYVFNCTVGTPAQNIYITIDTGTGDSSFTNETLTSENEAPDSTFTHTFNTTQSSTYNTSILTVRADNTSTLGAAVDTGTYSEYIFTYSSDNFSIAGIELDDLPFLISPQADDVNDTVAYYTTFYNQLGLGLPTSEAAIWLYSNAVAPSYPTFTQRLVNQGVIQSDSYSIWVDSEENNGGHLLLGGINTGRYQGSLVTLSTSLFTATSINGWTVLVVDISSLSISTGTTRSHEPIALSSPAKVALTQTPLTYLPSEVAVKIWNALGAEYDKDIDPLYAVPIVSCSFLTNSSVLNIQFSGASTLIHSVPMSDLVAHNGTGPTFTGGPYGSACMVQIRAGPTDVAYSLSASVMKRLYTVYDLSNNLLSVAFTDFNSTEDNIIEIPTGGIGAISPSALGTLAPLPTNSSNSVTRHKTIGLAVGLGVGIPVVIVLGFLFCWHRRRAAKSATAAQASAAAVAKAKLQNGKDDTARPVSELATSVNELETSDVRYVKIELSNHEQNVPRAELPEETVVYELPTSK